MLRIVPAINDVRFWLDRNRMESSGLKSVTNPGWVGFEICFRQPERGGSFSGGGRHLSCVLRDNFIGEAALLAAIGFFGAIIAGFVG